jgi:hypothetical protein
MGKSTDKTLPWLALLAGLGKDTGAGSSPGLQIAQIKTTEPDEVTLVLTGTALALDLDLFDVPVSVHPLRVGDRLLALPVGDTGRWSLLVKLGGGVTLATMQSASSLTIDGMPGTYGADRLVLPAGVLNTDGSGGVSRALRSGDRVSIAPMQDGEVIKYVILNNY